jgi:HNH endonuclease
VGYVLELPGLGKPTYCQGAENHNPKPLRYVWHHILPQEAGGQTTRENLASLCDSCFPGDTTIGYGQIRAASRRYYEGRLVDLILSDGRRLSATPNHPILTANGWTLAGLLQQGDQLVTYRRKVELVPFMDDVGRVPAVIGEVFDALRVTGPVRSASTEVNFHGERPRGDVDVVSANRQLLLDAEAAALESGSDLGLAPADAESDLLTRDSSSGQFVKGLGSTAAGSMGCVSELESLRCSHPRHAVTLGFTASATRNTRAVQKSFDCSLSNAAFVGEFYCGFAGEVSLHQLVGIGWREFSGHVFNIETSTGAYTANGVIAHNCHYAVHGILYQLARNGGRLTTLIHNLNTKRGKLAMQGYQAAVSAGTVNKIPNEGSIA